VGLGELGAASVALGEADAEGVMVSETTEREPGPEQATRPAARTRAMRRNGEASDPDLMMQASCPDSVR